MMQAMVEARRLAEMEGAQAAATSALAAELELLRRQKAAADEGVRRLDAQVTSLLPIVDVIGQWC